MKKRKQDIEEAEIKQELTPRELKNQERQAGVLKRQKARQKDKVARFAGTILLGMVLIIGFLLWVAGEMRQESNIPTNLPAQSGQRINVPIENDQDVFRVR